VSSCGVCRTDLHVVDAELPGIKYPIVPGHEIVGRVDPHRQQPRPRAIRFSNRPFGVKRFQTIRTLGVDVARGLVLLFGIGTKALPSLILVQTKLPPRLPLI
jgi:hypothetical protein